MGLFSPIVSNRARELRKLYTGVTGEYFEQVLVDRDVNRVFQSKLQRDCEVLVDCLLRIIDDHWQLRLLSFSAFSVERQNLV